MSRNHLPSVIPWNRERRTISRASQEDLVKRAKSKGRPELIEILSTRDDTDNILHQEHSVDHSINLFIHLFTQL